MKNPRGSVRRWGSPPFEKQERWGTPGLFSVSSANSPSIVDSEKTAAFHSLSIPNSAMRFAILRSVRTKCAIGMASERCFTSIESPGSIGRLSVTSFA